MNIGEASAVLMVVKHLTESALVDEYLPDDVVLATVELNGRARKALGAGPLLPSAWVQRHDEILKAQRRGRSS